MRLLAFIAEGFINTFGITRPKPEQEKLAHLIIGGILLTVIAGAFLAVGLMVFAIHMGGR
jgi:hypothetical protein